VTNLDAVERVSENETTRMLTSSIVPGTRVF